MSSARPTRPGGVLPWLSKSKSSGTPIFAGRSPSVAIVRALPLWSSSAGQNPWQRALPQRERRLLAPWIAACRQSTARSRHLTVHPVEASPRTGRTSILTFSGTINLRPRHQFCSQAYCTRSGGPLPTRDRRASAWSPEMGPTRRSSRLYVLHHQRRVMLWFFHSTCPHCGCGHPSPDGNIGLASFKHVTSRETRVEALVGIRLTVDPIGASPRTGRTWTFLGTSLRPRHQLCSQAYCPRSGGPLPTRDRRSSAWGP